MALVSSSAPVPPLLPQPVRPVGLDCIPAVGLGTHTLSGAQCYGAVLNALQCGYRHIDTASNYRNEEEVGRAIVASGVPRAEIFITTKLSPTEAKTGFAGVVAAAEASLRRLGVDYVDCYMMHWPGIGRLQPADDRNVPLRAECWAAMLELRRRGLCRFLGISNFKVRHIEALPSLPDVHQLEIHPLCRQQEVVDYCRAKAIKVQQYSPLAKMEPVFCTDARVLTACTALGVEPATLALLWGRWKGYDSVVVRSTVPERLAANLAVVTALAPALLQSTAAADVAKRAALEALELALGSQRDHHTCWDSALVK